MTPEQARAVADAVGKQLHHEWQATYKVIKALPDAKKDYKPEPNSRSAWDLAVHLATADIWFVDGVINGAFGQPDEKAPAPDASGVAEWYKAEFPKRLEQVRGMSGDKLAQVIDFYGMKMPAVQYFLFALVHMVHHRGQLTTYLRPMGAKVPSIYGSSFDQQWEGPPKDQARA